MEFAAILDFLHNHKPHFVHKKVKTYVFVMWCLNIVLSTKISLRYRRQRALCH